MRVMPIHPLAPKHHHLHFVRLRRSRFLCHLLQHYQWNAHILKPSPFRMAVTFQKCGGRCEATQLNQRRYLRALREPPQPRKRAMARWEIRGFLTMLVILGALGDLRPLSTYQYRPRCHHPIFLTRTSRRRSRDPRARSPMVSGGRSSTSIASGS